MSDELHRRLTEFAASNKFLTKGPLSVALVVTQHARDKGLPLDPENLLTGKAGQVLGLGKGAVQAILKRHTIDRVLASEGGRTSRGSIANMRAYVSLLNELHAHKLDDLDPIEKFWIAKVRGYFASKPFKLHVDPSRGLRISLREVLQQAEERQKAAPGVYYMGAMLQHLVGAKLECVLGDGAIEHNSFSTSDAQTKRAGDFHVGDVAIHVTTSPGENVIERCQENLNEGLRPMIVTTKRGLDVAEVLAENKGLGGRVDVFEVEQFMALNIYELGRFISEQRHATIVSIIEKYNEIIDDVETDPSLKIELRRDKVVNRQKTETHSKHET